MTTDNSVNVPLTARELELLEVAVQEFLYSTGREEHLAAPLHRLLSKLKQAQASVAP